LLQNDLHMEYHDMILQHQIFHLPLCIFSGCYVVHYKIENLISKSMESIYVSIFSSLLEKSVVESVLLPNNWKYHTMECGYLDKMGVHLGMNHPLPL
jgi:hypothetical protein